MRFGAQADNQGWLSPPFFLPRKLGFRLAEQGSLTRRLKQGCRQFSVHPIRVGLIRPNRDESTTLQFRPDRLAYVREVLLHCDNQPVVLAHGAVPDSALRGSLQYRRMHAGHALEKQARQAGVSTKTQHLWARRSLFTLQGHSMMVNEVFLPEVLSIKSGKK